MRSDRSVLQKATDDGKRASGLYDGLIDQLKLWLIIILMNLKAKEDAVGRLDEILFSSESTIKYLTNSKTVNVQSVEFSPNGDLVALALKSGLLLITDFMTMGIVRVFCANEDFGLSANEDIDQFFPLWKLMNYFEEDFVFKTKPQETAK